VEAAFDFAGGVFLAVDRPAFPDVFFSLVAAGLAVALVLPALPADFFTFRIDNPLDAFDPPALAVDFTALLADDFRFVFDLPALAGDFFFLSLAGWVFGVDLLAVAGSFLPETAPLEGFVLPSFDTSFTSLVSSGLEIKEACRTLSALAFAAERVFCLVLPAFFFVLGSSTFFTFWVGGSIIPKLSCSTSGSSGSSGSSGTSISFSNEGFSPSTARGTAQGMLTPSTW